MLPLRRAAGLSLPLRRTILAGCSGATAIAKLLHRRLLKGILAKLSTIRVKNVVDDIALRAVGPARTIMKQVAQETVELKDGLKKVGLPMSSNKTVFLANSTQAAEQYEQKSGLEIASMVEAARCLGADVTATCSERRAQAHAKGVRLANFQAAGADTMQVNRAGVQTSGLWGCQIAGLTPAQLATLRRSQAKACGRCPPGSSTGLKLGVAQGKGAADPFIEYSALVVQT